MSKNDKIINDVALDIKELLKSEELKKAHGNQDSFVDSFLGKIMQDEITGLKGTITAVAFNLDNNTTAYVVPKLKTGHEPAWVSVNTLKHVDRFITKNND